MKYLMVYLVSSVKFMFAFPFAAGYQFSSLETFIFTSLGGISGVLFFAFLTDPLVRVWNSLIGRKKISSESSVSKEKKINYKRNRRLIRLKNNYGLAGLILLTPCLISIPIGTFIIVRYFKSKTKVVLLLSATVIVYSISFSLLSEFFEVRVFDPIMHLFS